MDIPWSDDYEYIEQHALRREEEEEELEEEESEDDESEDDEWEDNNTDEYDGDEEDEDGEDETDGDEMGNDKDSEKDDKREETKEVEEVEKLERNEICKEEKANEVEEVEKVERNEICKGEKGKEVEEMEKLERNEICKGERTKEVEKGKEKEEVEKMERNKNCKWEKAEEVEEVEKVERNEICKGEKAKEVEEMEKLERNEICKGDRTKEVEKGKEKEEVEKVVRNENCKWEKAEEVEGEKEKEDDKNEERKEEERRGEKLEKVDELAEDLVPENNNYDVQKLVTVDRMRVNRRICLNAVLTIPLTTALLHIPLGFWLSATISNIKSQCEMELMSKKLNQTTTEKSVMDMATHNSTGSLCPEFLASHYISLSMALLPVFLVVAGAVRGIMTAFLYHHFQTDVHRKLLGKYAVITSLIIIATLVLTGTAYNNKPHPDDLRNDEAELMNLQHQLSTIFYYSVVEAIILCIILVYVAIMVCTDVMLERMTSILNMVVTV